MATNPAVSMPNSQRVAQALHDCPLVVVSDIVANTDTQAFAKCVSKIVDSQELWEEMSKAARQKALAYSWENVNGKLLDNYREALSEPRPQLKF